MNPTGDAKSAILAWKNLLPDTQHYSSCHKGNMTVTIKTTLIAIMTLIFFGITSHNDTLIASSLTSSDEQYDAEGIWVGGQETDEEFLEGLRQCIAMDWAGLENAGELRFELTESEKRNPGGGSVVVKIGGRIFVIEFLRMAGFRDVVGSRIIIQHNLGLNKSIPKERLLKAVNEWNIGQKHGWSALTENDDIVSLRSCLYLPEEYLSWDNLMNRIRLLCMNIGMTIELGVQDPDSIDLMTIFRNDKSPQ